VLAALGIEDVYVNSRGGESVSGRLGMSQQLASTTLTKSLSRVLVGGGAGTIIEPVVKIIFDSDEAKRFIKIEAQNTMADSQANLAAGLGG
jgi:hypothetical protein